MTCSVLDMCARVHLHCLTLVVDTPSLRTFEFRVTRQWLEIRSIRSCLLWSCFGKVLWKWLMFLSVGEVVICQCIKHSELGCFFTDLSSGSQSNTSLDRECWYLRALKGQETMCLNTMCTECNVTAIYVRWLRLKVKIFLVFRSFSFSHGMSLVLVLWGCGHNIGRCFRLFLSI